MKRNNALFGILTIIFLALGAVIFLTVQKLQQTTPVAPTVPQATPKASASACTLTFALAVSPTPTPTVTPTPPPGATPTPTPTPAPGCNSTCTTNADCSGGMTCFNTGSGSFCRNPSCTSQTNCVCLTPTPTPGGPTPTPTTPPTPQVPVSGNGPSVLGASVIAGGIFLLLLGLVF